MSCSRTDWVQSHYRIADWTDWLAANGRDDIIDIDGPIYDSSVLSFQAAVDGIGVAIGQTRLLEQDFADRTLLPCSNRLRATAATTPNGR